MKKIYNVIYIVIIVCCVIIMSYCFFTNTKTEEQYQEIAFFGRVISKK